MAQRRVEPTSQQVRVRETLASRSESYRLSPPRRGWQKNGPSDYQKVLNVQRLPHGRCQLSVQKVTNTYIFVVLPYVVIGGGLALNDTGFILVQATCPTSSLGRSVTLFLSPGARSLQWGYKQKGVKSGESESWILK